MYLQPGLTGVCGVLTYQLELDPEEEPEYVQVMFSVPYNLNSYDSYLAVGVSPVYLNSSDGGVFKTFYYYSGSFQRSKAGRMAEYQSDKGERVCSTDRTSNFPVDQDHYEALLVPPPSLFQ